MFIKAVVVDRAAVKYAAFLLAFYAALLLSLRADPRYPDWPCMQPKVPELSAAAMWSGPVSPDSIKRAAREGYNLLLDQAQTGITDQITVRLGGRHLRPGGKILQCQRLRGIRQDDQKLVAHLN